MVRAAKSTAQGPEYRAAIGVPGGFGSELMDVVNASQAGVGFGGSLQWAGADRSGLGFYLFESLYFYAHVVCGFLNSTRSKKSIVAFPIRRSAENSEHSQCWLV